MNGGKGNRCTRIKYSLSQTKSFMFYAKEDLILRPGTTTFASAHDNTFSPEGLKDSTSNLWCLTSDPIWNKGFEIHSCCSSRNLALCTWNFLLGNVELDLISFSARIESIWKFHAIPSNIVVNPTLRIRVFLKKQNSFLWSSHLNLAVSVCKETIYQKAEFYLKNWLIAA